MSGNGEDVTTIFVAGFPQDICPRDLDNLCRFMPGFVTSNVSTSGAKGVSLFVLFDAASDAYLAIDLLNNQPFDRGVEGGETMRASMARSNMRIPHHGPPPAAAAMGPPHPGFPPHAGFPPMPIWGPPPPGFQQPPPPTDPYPHAARGGGGGGGGGGGEKGGRGGRGHEDPKQIDTIASVGASDKGFDEGYLGVFFSSLPGFVEFKGNPRMGGGFVKFASHGHAQQAISSARDRGIPAELAKSNMNVDGGGGGGGGGRRDRGDRSHRDRGGDRDRDRDRERSRSRDYPPPRPAPAPAAAEKSGKRPRIAEDPSQVDTVACIGALEASGLDEAALRQFFEVQPGFLAFKGNQRMGGGFAKFATPDFAQAARAAAAASGVPAEMAKSSMSGTS